MSTKEGQEFYDSLSRKELQSLCKKYGLPARKSSSEMAESLFSYFQKKDSSLVTIDKSIGITTLHPEASLNLTGNLTKDGIHLRSCHGEEGYKGNRNIKSNELESCMGLRTYAKEGFAGSVGFFQGPSHSQFVSQYAGIDLIPKELPSSLSGRMEDTTQFRSGDMNVGVCPKEKASPAIRAYTKVPPSFEFFVSSEEGIKLSVDLNSSPADWIKRFKNQVSLSQNVGYAMSQSCPQGLGCGCIGESNKKMRGSFPQGMDPGEIKDDHVETKAYSGFVIEKNNIGIDHSDGGTESSMLKTRPCSIVLPELTDCLGEHQRPISSKLISDVENQIICNMESCSKNGYSATLESDITDTTMEKTASNFAINSISNCSVDLMENEHQNPKHDDEVCENSTLQNGHNRENNCVVYPGCLDSFSTEIPLSEAGNYCKDLSCSPDKNGEFLDLEDSKRDIESDQAALATSSGHCGNHLPPWSEELESNNIINGMESSVCSQVDNLVEKICLNSDNLESNEEFHKKRSFIYTEGQDSCSKHDTKILRSMKLSAAEGLLRRSMRLVSK